MQKNSKRKNIIIMILVFISVISVALFYPYEKTYSNKLNNFIAFNRAEDVVYLSDIPFRKATTAWGSILRDKTSSNTSLSLKVEGNQETFKKGIWAHANSSIEIDLTDYQDYAYFVTYYGLNVTAGNNGDGAKFYVYTSVDGINWTLRTDSNPKVYKGVDEAGYLKLDIKGAKYLKLEVNHNTYNGNDHSIWADAKLVKEDYKENVVKTVEEYDEEIKAIYNGEITGDLELLLLQRDLVKNAGQYSFKVFLNQEGKREENVETLNWLMNNTENLKLYLMGGKPNGSYRRSFEVLNTLYHTFKDDLTTEDVTSNGNKLSEIYKKMIISLSLTHSDNVSFWIHSQGATPVDTNPNVSDAATRYRIFKSMFLNNKLDSVFETLEIEEMRYIMYSFINDDEIEWLNAYAKTKSNRYSAYSYINYKNVNTALYRSPKYYGEGRKDYEAKYMLSGYNVKNVAYYPRLWMIMDVGGVCWQLSNVGQNVLTSLGIPATVVGQPGHTAYIVYGRDNLGRGKWDIWNDVGGWTSTNTSGYTGTRTYYQVRLLNGWGNGSYASRNSGSYVLLAQKALDDYENYVKAEELVKLADSYQNDYAKLEEIYRKALDIQNINFDAWLGLVNVYLNSGKTEKEYYNLALELSSALKYDPLPMHDLLAMLNKKVTSTDVKVLFTLLETRVLTEATKVTTSSVSQPNVVKIMANYLLGIIDKNVAEFSFDGEKANVLKLSSMYDSSHAYWEYSLDKGATWTEVTDGHSKTLSSDEINKITAENDILVHIIGTSRDPENIYTIDITKSSVKSGLYANDLENRVIGATDNEEWRFNENDAWTSFATLPDLRGDKTVTVRTRSTGTSLASDTQTFTFTQDNVDETATYIPITHLTVHDFISETDRVGNREYARNAIDGNINTMWHTNRKVVETNKYIVLKLDVPMHVSALEYVPYPNYNYGVMKDAVVSVSMDGENWTEVATVQNRANNDEKTMIKFDTVMEAKYVKLYMESHDGKFANAAMINLYHDSTKEANPTADVVLSTYDVTTENVIATLIYDKENLTITNNNGSDTYTFTKNGSFTFEYVNKKGIKGETTVVVSNIDHEKPTLTTTYGNTKKTNQPVLAILKFSEPVIILNEDLTLDVHTEENCYTYTFFGNGEHTIKFRDIAGNVNSAKIKVDWIDTTAPVGEVKYSTVSDTTKKVTATLTTNEAVTILNNGGKKTYTFKENGEFTFEFQDKAGNVGRATAVVTWIKEEPVVNINYSTTNKTTNPVVATLESKDNITILNNNGKNTYTFTENGEFTFIYKDALNNEYKALAKVDWITKENNLVEKPQEKPGNNNQETETNPNNNKPNNKPGNNTPNEEEIKYNTFSVNGLKLKIPTNIYNKKATLIEKKLNLNEEMQSKVGPLSEYFSLYLENDKGKLVKLPDSTYNLTITLDPFKEFKGIYEVKNGELTELSYEKINATKINVETKNLGQFVISYEEKKETINENIVNKKEERPVLKIVLAVVLISQFIVVFQVLKNKKTK